MVITQLAFADEVLSEEVLRDAVDLLVRLVEAAGALIIFTGTALAFWRFARACVQRDTEHSFTRIRLGFGRYLVLGLEFQLASDILRTAVAPTFEQIGQLAAIAAIRTLLNYFLGREIAAEREEVEGAVPP